jgi:hypothetical protein
LPSSDMMFVTNFVKIHPLLQRFLGGTETL